LGRPNRANSAGGRDLVLAGEKHWHGAAPTTAMTHIAIVEQLEGKSADWMEKVADEQYNGK
jgi:quercetin dioxygenase-like cupin family protein